MSIFDIDLKETAKQLTLMTSTLFSKLDYWEIANYSPNKIDRSSDGTITSIIQHFNKIGEWVATQILMKEQLIDRISVFQVFLEFANVFSFILLIYSVSLSSLIFKISLL